MSYCDNELLPKPNHDNVHSMPFKSGTVWSQNRNGGRIVHNELFTLICNKCASDIWMCNNLREIGIKNDYNLFIPLIIHEYCKCKGIIQGLLSLLVIVAHSFQLRTPWCIQHATDVALRASPWLFLAFINRGPVGPSYFVLHWNGPE